ncbi:MAG: hypothetical protein ABEK59_05895 [Halobacteria archaeon]
MEHPSYHKSRTYSSSFQELHKTAMETNFNGSYLIEEDTASGVSAYLEGWPIYAKYNGVNDYYGANAIQELSVLNKKVTEYVSSNALVKMFRTYMKYIGLDEGFMDIFEKPEIQVPERKILISKGDEVEKKKIPTGVRLGYSPNRECMFDYFRDTKLTGYALSNEKIWYFDKGRARNRERLKENGLPMLMRIGSEINLGVLDTEFSEVYLQSPVDDEVDIEYDISGWEIVDSARGGSNGFLSSILSKV